MTSDIAPESVRREVRRTLALAWPVMLASLNWTLLHIIDVAVVGGVSTFEAAAFGASRSLTYVVIMVLIGMMTGVLVFTAQADGAGDRAATGRALHDGLLLAGVVAAIGAVPYFLFAEPLLAWMGIAPSLVPTSAAVIRLMALAMPFQLVLIVGANFLEGISRPRRVAFVNVGISLPLNAVLAWAWATGALGFPRWGAVGAAAATLVSLVVASAVMLIVILVMRDARERGVRPLFRRRWSDRVRGAVALARFGAMPSFASGLELAGFSLLIVLSTQLGNAVAHAFQMVFTLHNLSFAVALGFASAAGVRVGNAVGEGAPHLARQRVRVALALAALGLGLIALIYVAGARWIVDLYPASDDVHRIAIAMLTLWAPFLVFDGMQVVLQFALRSLGDQVAAGLISIVAFFGVSGFGGWWLVRAGWGADALVIGSVAGMVMAALLFAMRFAWIQRRAAQVSAATPSWS